jgi:hypothetical protein
VVTGNVPGHGHLPVGLKSVDDVADDLLDGEFAPRLLQLLPSRNWPRTERERFSQRIIRSRLIDDLDLEGDGDRTLQHLGPPSGADR